MINLEITIVPMLRVGMQPVTLRVTHQCRCAHPSQDAERPERHSHAERGSDDLETPSCLCSALACIP
ncbi:hypothetical protein CXB36_02005 [Pseudomonas syringae pv. syringae]|nr:hypothetical protein BKC06_001235 [Pseudomonas syringae pv. syringae]POP68953.1 hypothetical protein CXB36_02005 [Pseudomonas syringae pv. syringae]